MRPGFPYVMAVTAIRQPPIGESEAKSMKFIKLTCGTNRVFRVYL